VEFSKSFGGDGPVVKYIYPDEDRRVAVDFDVLICKHHGCGGNGMNVLRSISHRRLSTVSDQGQLLRCTAKASPVCARLHSRLPSTAPWTTAKLPVQIPASGAVDLTPLRGFVALHGPDAAKFLQGLITKIFPSETEPTGMFTSFLTPQVNSTL
jgi:hypothetical protein